MTMKELQTVKDVLLRIRGPHPAITEAIALVDRDLARREKQSKDWHDNLSEVPDGTWGFR